MGSFFKHKWFWMPLVGIALVAVVFSFFRKGDDAADADREMAFSDVIAAGQAGRLESIEVTGRNIDVRLKDDDVLYESRVGYGADIASTLLLAEVPIGGSEGVRLEFDRPTTASNLIGIVIPLVPIVIFVVILYFAVYWAVRRALRERPI